MARIKYVIEYKYPGEHWLKYDESSVEEWADVQEMRAKREHPDAEVRIRPVR